MKRARTTVAATEVPPEADPRPTTSNGYLPPEIWTQIINAPDGTPRLATRDYLALAATCRATHSQLGGTAAGIAYAARAYDAAGDDERLRDLFRVRPLETFLPSEVCEAVETAMHSAAREILGGWDVLDFLDATRRHDSQPGRAVRSVQDLKDCEAHASLTGGLMVRLLRVALQRAAPAYLRPSMRTPIDASVWGVPDIDLILEPRAGTGLPSIDSFDVAFPQYTPRKLLSHMLRSVPETHSGFRPDVKFRSSETFCEYTFTPVDPTDGPPLCIQQLASSPFNMDRPGVQFEEDDASQLARARITSASLQSATRTSLEQGFDLAVCQCMYRSLSVDELYEREGPTSGIWLSPLAFCDNVAGMLHLNKFSMNLAVRHWVEDHLRPFQRTRATAESAATCFEPCATAGIRGYKTKEKVLQPELHQLIVRMSKYTQRGFDLAGCSTKHMPLLAAACEAARIRTHRMLARTQERSLAQSRAHIRDDTRVLSNELGRVYSVLWGQFDGLITCLDNIVKKNAPHPSAFWRAPRIVSMALFRTGGRPYTRLNHPDNKYVEFVKMRRRQTYANLHLHSGSMAINED